MSDQIEVRVNSHGPGRALSLVYRDSITGKRVVKSSGIRDTGPKARKEAERAAAVLQDELNSGRYKPASKITFQEARERFEAEHLAGLGHGSPAGYNAALNHLERLINPDRLSKLTSATLSRFRTLLRDEGMKETTIAGQLRHIKSFLNWAVRMGLIPQAPRIEMPKRAKGQTMMRGRPITAEEFDRMLMAVAKVRSDDAHAWVRYLTGLWLSGLRLEESLVLSWDEDSPFSVDFTGKRPRFRIYSEAQKAKRDELLPMTPDFAEWLLQTPEVQRTGLVFKLPVPKGGQITRNWAGRVIGQIGEKAGVIVNKEAGKYATAHDLRRAFGTRWAKRVMPAVLQRLMRHADIQTTMAYYVGLNADAVADELWAAFGPGKGSGYNTSYNNPPANEGITGDVASPKSQANR